MTGYCCPFVDFLSCITCCVLHGANVNYCAAHRHAFQTNRSRPFSLFVLILLLLLAKGFQHNREREREREGEIVFCYPSELSKISKTNLLSRRGRAAASHWFVKVDIKGSIRISLSFFLCAFLNFFSLPPFIYSHAATLFFLYFVIDFVFFISKMMNRLVLFEEMLASVKESR